VDAGRALLYKGHSGPTGSRQAAFTFLKGPAMPPPAPDPQVIRGKVAWRTIPLLFLCYIIAYLDRANAGFVKPQMQESLGFGDDVFGWAFGIFFVGYLVLEIPGALLVEHWSARKWFARILITWGLCSMALALVRTAWQFYLARFLLGLAEAGFFPGVVVYLTHWFPRAERGRAMAALVLAIPICLALGAWTAGLLLGVGWFGLQGWQWVFLVEGFPAVLLGLVMPFLLTDRPRDAHWLTDAERDVLENTLQDERRQAAILGGFTLKQALRRPTVWLLAAGILAANTGGYALLFWLPSTVNNLLKATGTTSPTAFLTFMGVHYSCGLPGVVLAGWSSDRTGERKWHCAAGMMLTAVFVVLSMTPGLPLGAAFGLLCCAGFFAFSWPPPFWVLPTLTLSASAAAVSIGFINICANVAGLLGPPAFGLLKGAGLDDRVCLILLAGCYACGGAVIALLRVPRTPAGVAAGPAAEKFAPAGEGSEGVRSQGQARGLTRPGGRG
jgi:ACS family tartrate transporter-like MFS transporter